MLVQFRILAKKTNISWYERSWMLDHHETYSQVSKQIKTTATNMGSIYAQEDFLISFTSLCFEKKNEKLHFIKNYDGAKRKNIFKSIF